MDIKEHQKLTFCELPSVGLVAVPGIAVSLAMTVRLRFPCCTSSSIRRSEQSTAIKTPDHKARTIWKHGDGVLKGNGFHGFQPPLSALSYHAAMPILRSKADSSAEAFSAYVR